MSCMWQSLSPRSDSEYDHWQLSEPGHWSLCVQQMRDLITFAISEKNPIAGAGFNQSHSCDHEVGAEMQSGSPTRGRYRP